MVGVALVDRVKLEAELVEPLDGILVGVAVVDCAREEVRLRGGGPIAPSTRFRFAVGVDPEMEADVLCRTERARAVFAANGGSLFFRSFVTLPVSERTDGGREALGVPKIDDSRR